MSNVSFRYERTRRDGYDVAYMDFILDRLRDKNPDGSLSIMYVVVSRPSPACKLTARRCEQVHHTRCAKSPPLPVFDIPDPACVAGEKSFPEEELSHLDGHKGSKPVR